MKQDFTAVNFSTLGGNPDGGTVHGLGLTINWQRGPLVFLPGEAPRANGCFVETLLQAALQRLQYYQGTRFQCQENAEAIRHLQGALTELNSRTQRRQDQGVAGTHVPDLVTGDANPAGPVG